MEYNPIRLRISAKKLYERLFFDVRMCDFFNFSGYQLSGHGVSVDSRAGALAKYCKSPKSTVRRWITGESQPNGTNTFLIYGATLALVYDGDQVRMLYEFIRWHDRSLLNEYFYLDDEIEPEAGDLASE